MGELRVPVGPIKADRTDRGLFSDTSKESFDNINYYNETR